MLQPDIIMSYLNKLQNKTKRQRRVRAKFGLKLNRPRLSVFRSNHYIYAQIIDDIKGKTLVSESDLARKEKGEKASKTQKAFQVGEQLAKKALKKNIKTVAFDRGSNKYHGRIKALAEGARKGGLEF